jgi:predicted RecB family nuclease
MPTVECITLPLLRAYLSCQTKFHKLAHAERAPDSTFVSAESRILDSYRRGATEHLSKYIQGAIVGFEKLPNCNMQNLLSAVLVDCETAVFEIASPVRAPPPPGAARRALGSAPSPEPLLFLPNDKPRPTDTYLLCFAALAMERTTGLLSKQGRLVYGPEYSVKVVKLDKHYAGLGSILARLSGMIEREEAPTLVLNKHCSVCDYAPVCHESAIAKDDLSLIATLSEKDLRKLREKGISTITQLSYGYRPRRRRSRSGSASSIKTPKYDPKLKALSIKKGQAHVVGTPSIPEMKTEVYFDVEGMPDRASYYLIGIRYKQGGGQAEQSFWADGQGDERRIWQECLSVLRGLENPTFIHYGSYETTFLKKMMQRYPELLGEGDFVRNLIRSSINLVSITYSQVYFPTYTNSLKDIAQYVGFKWTEQNASGGHAILWRAEWELFKDASLKDKLIRYNMEDCHAIELVARRIRELAANAASSDSPSTDAINVSSLEVGFSRIFGKFPGVLPDFDKINEAAYWDYQRSRVYIRSDKKIKRIGKGKESREAKAPIKIDKVVHMEDVRPQSCKRCGSSRIWTREGTHSQPKIQIVTDLKFSRSGVRRQVKGYRYRLFRCGSCRAEMSGRPMRTSFGHDLCSYIIYQKIELRMSHQKICDNLFSLFGVNLTSKDDIQRIKTDMAKLYEPVYDSIKAEIASGHLVHVDETRAPIPRGAHYMWVFTNLASVAYVYSASREGTVLDDTLSGFQGVLVSDFYAAYDSVPCKQQKCLIHLMRDINEDLLKNPFNAELKDIAQRFGNLLRRIVETIDEKGLRARYLSKHKAEAKSFLGGIYETEFCSEVAISLQRRLKKVGDKLFTFLDHNGVPWNNNNAEHAVREFTRIRNTMATSTDKGMRDYAILLSIQQTLKYRGMSFLDFLRSGRMTLDPN